MSRDKIYLLVGNSVGSPTLQFPKLLSRPKNKDQDPLMSGCHGMLGWKEFLQNRLDILREFDRARSVSASRPVHTEYGDAVEAFIRFWLGDFLPQRYAVTSGFIIPNVLDVDAPLYHYDVIIYDRLSAPVLWVSNNTDRSDTGKSRAISAKHVLAVYEIKSTLDKRNAKAAVNKLAQLVPIAATFQPQFSCGILFIDLPTSQYSNLDLLKTLLEAESVRGFWGGVVLRTPVDTSFTGLFVVTHTSDHERSNVGAFSSDVLAKSAEELGVYLVDKDGVEVATGGGNAVRAMCIAPDTWAVTKVFHASFTEFIKSIQLMWSHSGFADFAIHFLNSLEGISLWSEDTGLRTFALVFDTISQRPSQ